jgi:hypothetical protein
MVLEVVFVSPGGEQQSGPVIELHRSSCGAMLYQRHIVPANGIAR